MNGCTASKCRALFGCLCAVLGMSVPQSARPQGVREDGASGRPRVGLVLAGGGAKGGAHVGVLKVLEELQVPIDCIAGTSMGALVGAGYVSVANFASGSDG